MILDGFGIGKDTPFNAIANARMPFFKSLLNRYPHAQLLTHGNAVGLPDGVMGNSEVGHMTLGAGRTIYQDLTRISQAISNGSFSALPVLNEALRKTTETQTRLHLLGLLSDGGVHSHRDHLWALLDLCQAKQLPEVYLHIITDGRDTPPKSSLGFLAALLSHPWIQKGNAKIASISGRYYTMDRDLRWDRVKKAYCVLTGQVGPASTYFATPSNLTTNRAEFVIQKSHADGKTDEFIEPILLEESGRLRDGDTLIFFNFRSDRAREITAALTQADFSGFDRGKTTKALTVVSMTQYDKEFKNVPVLFGPQSQDNIFGQWLENHNLSQFRIAETEKYAHVTFFFNGGREAPFQNEERLLIPSPREVPTYDLKPEMSAYKIATAAADQISSEQKNFVLMNFANADMVGHTGNYDAALQAAEVLDQCIAQVLGTATYHGYQVLLTADHGNAEEMKDCSGEIHTQHTLNPVPVLWVPPSSTGVPRSTLRKLNDGTLADIMPTLCELMRLPVPPEVTGKSLLPKDWSL
jgi:2,3-bisphosphoglycerate-independent phosphoglycerate mutase